MEIDGEMCISCLLSWQQANEIFQILKNSTAFRSICNHFWFFQILCLLSLISFELQNGICLLQMHSSPQVWNVLWAKSPHKSDIDCDGPQTPYDTGGKNTLFISWSLLTQAGLQIKCLWISFTVHPKNKSDPILKDNLLCTS